MSPGSLPKTYDTRFDRFRAREGLSLKRWAAEGGMSRTQIAKYRAGQADPRTNTMAVLARAASAILKRPVSLAELFDLGEEEPVFSLKKKEGPAGWTSSRLEYDTRFDRWLLGHGVRPNAVARSARITRQSLRMIRTERSARVLR